MKKKHIRISQFANELEQRLNSNKTVDCCKEELLNLTAIIKQKIGEEMIEVSWVE